MYFILTKPKDSNKSIMDNKENQVIHLNDSKLCYILPQNLMTCYCNNGLFESYLIEWCKQFCSKEKTFLDIGAHTGTYTLSLSECSKQVVSFEPQIMTYYALCGSVALSNLTNVQCLNFGLGSEEQVGNNILNITSNDGGGSSIHIQNEMPILRKEVIKIETLDSLGLTDIGFIKMDVEDNEYFVLLGAKKTLEVCNYPPILFECNDSEKNTQLFDCLKEMKYKIFKLNGMSNMYLANLK